MNNRVASPSRMRARRAALLVGVVVAAFMTACSGKTDKETDPVTGAPLGQSRMSPLALGCFEIVSTRGLASQDSVWISSIEQIVAHPDLLKLPEVRHANLRRLSVQEVGKTSRFANSYWYADNRSRSHWMMGDMGYAYELTFVPGSEPLVATVEFGSHESSRSDTLGSVELRKVSCDRRAAT